MRTGILYGFNVIQLLGLGLLCWSWKAGGAVMMGSCLGQIIYITREESEKRKFKTCPKCQVSIPKRLRLCPGCGYQYEKGLEEGELMDYIEQEREEADRMTSEEIDYNFEKMEQFVIDEVASFDGDIQDFLDRRELGDNTVGRAGERKVSRM